MKPITEDKIEALVIEVLQSIGWEYVHGLAIAPGAEQAERENFEQIILIERLRKAVSILNPDIPHDAQEQAIQKVLRIYSPELLHNKCAVSIHDGAFQTNKERMPGLTPGVRKIYNPHPASPAGCNIRYLSCVVYTIPYLRILCKFLPNVF